MGDYWKRYLEGPRWANMANNDIEEESPAVRKRKENEYAAEKAARNLTKEALKREKYARNVKNRASMTLKRGAKPNKIQQPCKWVVDEFSGEECWAYEYTDPKTGKRVCPHTCQRLHPGEEGWHKEWLKNSRWRRPSTGGRRTRRSKKTY